MSTVTVSSFLNAAGERVVSVAGTGCRCRGAGNNGPRQHRYSVQSPERGWHDGRVTISERVEARDGSGES